MLLTLGASVAQDTIMVLNNETPLDTTIIVEQDTIANRQTISKDTVNTTPYEYNWRDVRVMRDSLRTALRITRSELHSGVKQMRDSVRREMLADIRMLPHEIRIGWGDMLFENLIWQEKQYPTILPDNYSNLYKENYRYTQHIFAEYLYNVSYWYSFGMMIDYSGLLWDNVTRNGKGLELERVPNQQAHNIVLMPVVRFAYYHSDYATLYSALGAGLDINTGTEIDYKGRTTAIAPAINISLLGVRVGKGRYFGSIELGGMIALSSTNEVYMLGSRLFTASIGCRL